jgi:hypothetical protein
MPIKPRIRFCDQPLIESPLAPSGLVAAAQHYRVATRIERKCKFQTPSPASNRSSFMLGYFEPFKVSTRGLPRCGPNCSSSLTCTSSSSLTTGSNSSYSGSNSGEILRTTSRSNMSEDTYVVQDIWISTAADQGSAPASQTDTRSQSATRSPCPMPPAPRRPA